MSNYYSYRLKLRRLENQKFLNSHREKAFSNIDLNKDLDFQLDCKKIIENYKPSTHAIRMCNDGIYRDIKFYKDQLKTAFEILYSDDSPLISQLELAKQMSVSYDVAQKVYRKLHRLLRINLYEMRAA